MDNQRNIVHLFQQIILVNNEASRYFIYFNINTGLKFPKLGRNLQRKRVPVQFSQKFKRAVVSLSKSSRFQIFVKRGKL